MKDSYLANNLNYLLNIGVRSCKMVFDPISCISSSQSYKLENIWSMIII
ncbi:MAG: hypothetical protein FWH29_02015 [Methanobrevibacter sp.]|nr:hypothetical protein [Methanobrevibacter sp.]